jgi:hypothetical protein
MDGYQYVCAASNLVQSNVMSNIAMLAVVPSTATAGASRDYVSDVVHGKPFGLGVTQLARSEFHPGGRAWEI